MSERVTSEVARLKKWVADLQSGLYVNCVYCGHRYGPGETTPVSMADALKAHIEQCPEHPLSQARARIAELDVVVVAFARWANAHKLCEEEVTEARESACFDLEQAAWGALDAHRKRERAGKGKAMNLTTKETP